MMRALAVATQASDSGRCARDSPPVIDKVRNTTQATSSTTAATIKIVSFFISISFYPLDAPTPKKLTPTPKKNPI